MKITQKKQSKKKEENTQSSSKTLKLPKIPENPKEYQELFIKESASQQFYPLKCSPLDIKGQFRKLKYNVKRHEAMLINMELNTGNFKVFYVYPEFDSFTFKKGRYLIDNELKYFLPELNVWCLDYHEAISTPFKRRFDTNDLYRQIKNKGIIPDVYMAMNPKNLEYFMKSSVIQKIVQGAEADKFFRFIKTVTVIILLVVVIHFVLFLQASGMLENLNI